MSENAGRKAMKQTTVDAMIALGMIFLAAFLGSAGWRFVEWLTR